MTQLGLLLLLILIVLADLVANMARLPSAILVFLWSSVFGACRLNVIKQELLLTTHKNEDVKSIFQLGIYLSTHNQVFSFNNTSTTT